MEVLTGSGAIFRIGAEQLSPIAVEIPAFSRAEIAQIVLASQVADARAAVLRQIASMIVVIPFDLSAAPYINRTPQRCALIVPHQGTWYTIAFNGFCTREEISSLGHGSQMIRTLTFCASVYDAAQGKYTGISPGGPADPPGPWLPPGPDPRDPYIPPPPPSWTERENNRNWIDIASSSDGSKLIAAVYNGQLYTSDDYGATWTARESIRGWYSVASSADGAKLVACVYGGQIYTSTNYGVSWTARESSRAWIAVASSDDGAKLVALNDGGNIYTSTDSGASWADRGMGGQDWYGAASSSDGVKLAVASFADHIYTSINSGVNWTERSNFGGTGGPRSIASSSDGTRLLAGVGGGSVNYLYISSDSGANWTQRESARHWLGVASSADGSKLAAIDHSGKIYVSADYGVSWTAENENRAWSAIASNADGTRLAAVVSGGKIYTRG